MPRIWNDDATVRRVIRCAHCRISGAACGRVVWEFEGNFEGKFGGDSDFSVSSVLKWRIKGSTDGKYTTIWKDLGTCYRERASSSG
eukprot:221322-Prorocentrum_minimum.AAC.1